MHSLCGLGGRPRGVKACGADWKTGTRNTHNPTSQRQTLGSTKFTLGDGSVHYFKAKAADIMHFTPCGVKLAEELNYRYNTEHTLHVLHCATALMDFYKCLETGMAAHITWGSIPNCM